MADDAASIAALYPNSPSMLPAPAPADDGWPWYKPSVGPNADAKAVASAPHAGLRAIFPNSPGMFKVEPERGPDPAYVAMFPSMFTEAQRAAVKASPAPAKAVEPLVPVESAKTALDPAEEARRLYPNSPSMWPEPLKPAAALADAYADLAWPEDVARDDAAFGQFKEAIGEMKLPKLGAQKLVDMHVAVLRQQAEAAAAKAAGWLDAVQADKEMGGANYAQTERTGQAIINRFGDDALKDVLAETGLGNHPALIRFALKVAQTLGRAEAESLFARNSARTPGTPPYRT